MDKPGRPVEIRSVLDDRQRLEPRRLAREAMWRVSERARARDRGAQGRLAGGVGGRGHLLDARYAAASMWLTLRRGGQAAASPALSL